MLTKLGSRIVSLRKSKNLSQEELAELLNVSRQTISKWENQDVLPDAYNLVGLSKLFHVSTDELLLGKAQSIYQSSSMIHEMKKKRDQYSNRGKIFAFVGSALFVIPLIIVTSLGLEEDVLGYVAAGLVSVFGIFFAIAVYHFVKSSSYSNEFKYLERLQRQKSSDE